MIGIYKITNPKKAVYIGQSNNIKKRWNTYRKMANPLKEQPRIYRSFKKYGVENHKFEILTECDECDLNKLERYYQELYNCLGKISGLNCSYVSHEGRSGKLSDDVKKKMSDSQKGRKILWGHKISKSLCKFSPDNLKQIIPLFEGGYTLMEISIKFNTSRDVIRKIKNGLYFNLTSDQSNSVKKLIQEKKENGEAIKKYILSNHKIETSSAISSQLKISKGSVTYFLFKNRITKIRFHRWTEEECNYLLEKYKFFGDTDLAEMFDNKFPRIDGGWTKKHIEKKRKYLNLKRSNQEEFALRSKNSKANRIAYALKNKLKKERFI